MENENINTNSTDTQMNSTNESKSESFANEALTANTNYGTISALDIETGTAELVLIPPFEGDDGGISVACVEGDDSSCNMASQTDRDNAILLTLDQWKCDSITDTVSERWYKFHISEDATYTIYTTGSTNTTGRLYDHDGNFVTMNDDRAGSLNFRIVYPLSVDSYESDSGWYYVKVTTPQTETGEFHIRVIKRVLVSKVTVSDANITLDIGETYTLSASVYPDNADNKRISFSSYNTDVATIDPDTGVITALSPGIANICAFDWNNDGEPGRCEVWVRGKTPVFLLHGRLDDTSSVWGTDTLISDYAGPRNNSHFDSRIDATTTSAIGPIRYIDISAQEITNVHNQTNNEEGNLAYYLKNGDGEGNGGGYEENINLFSFNYPNKDAVKHSAEKLERYIENLIAYVRENGSDKMKTSFYPSRNDYSINNYKINIVGHSMGGLVARYYIENLGYDNHVDKLITVCTPHWGCNSADYSCSAVENIGDNVIHCLCDHDLRPLSNMYGYNKYGTSLNCILLNFGSCAPNGYELTDELNYSIIRNTRYYAIAGISNIENDIDKNDLIVEGINGSTTYTELDENIRDAIMLKENVEVNFYPSVCDDNVVDFISQIGWSWTASTNDYPDKIVPMEDIFIDIDTNGGNGPSSNFHSKILHRMCVIKKIIFYLESI